MSEPALKTNKGPKWKHVVIVEQPVNVRGKNEGDPHVRCVYCDLAFRGGATRICNHLLGGIGISLCPAIPADAKAALAEQHKTKSLKVPKTVGLYSLTKNYSVSNSDPSSFPLTASSSQPRQSSLQASFAKFCQVVSVMMV